MGVRHLARKHTDKTLCRYRATGNALHVKDQKVCRWCLQEAGLDLKVDDQTLAVIAHDAYDLRVCWGTKIDAGPT